MRVFLFLSGPLFVWGHVYVCLKPIIFFLFPPGTQVFLIVLTICEALFPAWCFVWVHVCFVVRRDEYPHPQGFKISFLCWYIFLYVAGFGFRAQVLFPR